MEESKAILKEVLDLGYNAIKVLHTTVQNMSKEALDPQSKERVDIMANVMILINDIMSPAHEISRTMLNESEHKFLDYLIELAAKSKEIAEEVKAKEKEKEKVNEKKEINV